MGSKVHWRDAVGSKVHWRDAVGSKVHWRDALVHRRVLDEVLAPGEEELRERLATLGTRLGELPSQQESNATYS